MQAEAKAERPRVCVVDDDPAILAALAALLQSEFEVVVARNGHDALRLARKDPPDLILLDVQMPDLDGFAVCRRLKDDPLTAEVPVVFLTAQGDEATEVRGLTAGADDFIAKPLRGAVVLARTRNLVRMKRLADQLKREALRDGLTGLANRKHFTHTLRDELLRAARQHRPVAVLMFDVDFFKAFNDHYGHLAGDGALVRVGQLLSGLARRAGDLAGRLGGEEFALLLPDTDTEGAMRVAWRALEGFAKAAIPHAASPISGRLSCSIGGASFVPASDVSADPAGPETAPMVPDQATELLAQADAALYRAKHLGRNRACTLESPPLTLGAEAA